MTNPLCFLHLERSVIFSLIVQFQMILHLSSLLCLSAWPFCSWNSTEFFKLTLYSLVLEALFLFYFVFVFFYSFQHFLIFISYAFLVFLSFEFCACALLISSSHLLCCISLNFYCDIYELFETILKFPLLSNQALDLYLYALKWLCFLKFFFLCGFVCVQCICACTS